MYKILKYNKLRFRQADSVKVLTPRKGKEYLKKMGGIILVASILVWALGYFGAKEIVASTIGVLGGLDAITPLAAYAYLLFVLLYFPCIATIVAIKNETGTWRWAVIPRRLDSLRAGLSGRIYFLITFLPLSM